MVGRSVLKSLGRRVLLLLLRRLGDLLEYRVLFRLNINYQYCPIPDTNYLVLTLAET